jgi:hypothetical protein
MGPRILDIDSYKTSVVFATAVSEALIVEFYSVVGWYGNVANTNQKQILRVVE